jgi:acyl-CoA:acyl-CoA alkyltransferase
MKYNHVCIESIAYTLPEEIVSSEQLERRLEPLYSRLRLPMGRLELMTGIRERRFWKPGTMPSEISVISANRAIEAAGMDRRQIGALIHGSVCRDYLEPATSCGVHHRLELPRDCASYDVSNACLGVLNGIVQVANMIELGQICAGLVVGSEGSRELVETAIFSLNADQSLTRDSVKPAMASLTIGSASAAVLLMHRDLSRSGNQLLSATIRCNTAGHELCHSGRDEAAAGGMKPVMQTDAETLMHAGVAIGRETFDHFLTEVGWSVSGINKTACHQVGAPQRKLMLETFGIDPAIDFSTFPWLGNTGAAAMPTTLAVGIERGHYQPGDQIAMLGIGSGINVLMLALKLKQGIVAGGIVS